MKKQISLAQRISSIILAVLLSVTMMTFLNTGAVYADDEGGETPPEAAVLEIGDISDATYTGKEIKPALNVTAGEATLTEGKDYEVSYENNINVGEATVTVTGIDAYKDSTPVSGKFTINPESIANAKVTNVKNRENFTSGTVVTQTPTVQMTLAGSTVTLKNGTDYTLEYKNNNKAGTATMIVKGKGNFTGKKEVSFKIYAKADNKGWQQRNGVWYYYKSNGVKLTNGWAKDTHGWCWMDSSGRITKNRWIKYKGQWYYLKPNGYMAANAWAKDSKGWCWMDKDGHIVKSKWVKSGGAWYYLKANGYMAANDWARDSIGWCWLGSNGKLVKSKWILDGGHWYYIKPNGYMAANTWAKDSKGWCFMKGNGMMAKNEGVKSSNQWYYINYSGYMETRPYVIVSKADQMLFYYENGSLVLKTAVVTGKWYPKDHDTPTGTYHVRAKQTDQILRGLEDDGKTKYESHVNYWMPFIGNSYGLHDATWRGSFGGTIYKYSGSHGCVNMPYSKAKELYGKIKVNTIVRIQ